ncbi:MAG: signal peptide peptidase SppA [Chlorobi bacterium]|nr:signal peptide peptidase SppA [Chlorobiota bacterium]
MKQFFKFFLAVVLGGLVTFGIVIFFIFVFIAGMAAVAGSGDDNVKIKENTVLVLNIDGPVVERTSNDPFAEAISAMQNIPGAIGLNVILKDIRKAKRDKNIAGIYIEPGMVDAGFATLEEIRNALIDFKESGKFIISFAPVYSQRAYYLASVADSIYLNPSGLLEFKGLYAQRVFYRGTLEKLGVDMQVVKHGKFKSAVEPFIRDNMSEPARLQTETYINSIWGHLLGKISEQRGISRDSLMKLADEMVMFRDQESLVDAGLIDGLKYKDEVISDLKKLTGRNDDEDVRSVSVKKYSKVYVRSGKKGFAKDKIALIYAEGEIDGVSRDGIDSKELSKTIRKARRDSSIKAIVLRVNSPGGSALGSEIIWREVKLAKEVKPVVVSMGDLAASGGYYISCAADKIIAQPVTLTGSIGIFGLIPNTQGLMKKIGLSFDGVKTNKFADMPSTVRPFTQDEKQLMQAYIEMGYKTFITRCADGRNTTPGKIDEIGQGRVWSGENAVSINLVDTLGNISDAIEMAKNMAKLDNYRIVELPKIPDPFEQFIKDLTGDVKMTIGKHILGEDYKLLRTVESLKNGYQIQARLPFDMSVN